MSATTRPQLMSVFDVTGPLPTGTTLLEASAGTGKTYTIAALVTRFVAEGVATLDAMLVVTFGRAASQELRERVRETLVRAERALADPDRRDDADPVVAHLLALPDRHAVHGRLRTALAGFDAATIATTHQFCQLVLRSLGVAGDTEPEATLVESLDELLAEVVDDLYLRLHGDREPPLLSPEEALEVARRAVADPQARLVHTELSPQTPIGARVAFAQAAREELERRKRRLRVLSYDDLLARLADALQPDPQGEGDWAAASERMRARWRIVLVDEFQDTDPVQWHVIERAFVGVATVVLIGDPKQAIYAFRGGDVEAYLQAAARATRHATLGRNHRSDPSLLASLQVVLAGAELGHELIRVHPVAAARTQDRLVGAPGAPWRMRLLARTPELANAQGEIPVATARALVAADCAADIHRLLDSGATWDGAPLRAAQVAVLVHAREAGELVRRELGRLGIPAVLTGSGNIMATAAAADWLTLLEALNAPQRSSRVRAAALTPFVGVTAADLDAGGAALTETLAERARTWAGVLQTSGVAAVLETAERSGLGARVLAEQGGERRLTDLRHLGGILHEAASRERMGLGELIGWLRRERDRESVAAERTRRLDSDAAAVQILTIHASKGLQFPVVYLPFEFESFERRESIVRFHDDAGERCLDVAGAGPHWAAHTARARAEEAGERLRLLYVALTRAQSQVVTWWAATRNTPPAALHRLLFGRPVGGGPGAVPAVGMPVGTGAVPARAAVPRDVDALEVLRSLGELGGPTLDPPSAVGATAPAGPADLRRPAYTVRAWERAIDSEWRRTSYSALVAAADQPPGVGSEPESPTLADELLEPIDSDAAARPTSATPAGISAESADPSDPAPARAALLPAGLPPGHPADRHTPQALLSPMAQLPSGATFGSLVHAVLERTDPAAGQLHDQLAGHAAEALRWWPADVEPDQLAAALVPVLRTPLGPLAPGLTLADLPLADRLCELTFELPLAGGDDAPAAGRADVRLGQLAPLLREHLDADDPLAPYAVRLTAAELRDQPLRGYLTGSLDAVLRVPDSGVAGGSRFLIVDYKTNLLGTPTIGGERPLVTSADYGRTELIAAMLHSDYPLQALLYSVVLHRFLRWRVPGYTPTNQLGGVLYLFVRGMCGPATPVIDGHPAGVFSWSPPADLVVAMSDWLAGGAR